MIEKVLLVDDEPNVLQGYVRNLRKQFNIKTCTSGIEALETVNKEGPFAVVVSDMRMPKMDGVEFLSELKSIEPNTVRIMLTGNSDQQTAIDAVNKGDVFRFLNKPCSPESMATTLNNGIQQYRLINAERELLDKTVKGSVAVLAEVLSLTKPDVFGRTNRYKSNIIACAKQLGIEVDWALESMALLSLVGTVSLSDALVHKALSGEVLTEDEIFQFNQHPQAGANVLHKIPRMEALAESIRYQRKNFDGSGEPRDEISGAEIPIGARLLRVVAKYDSLEQSGMESTDILSKMAANTDKYDPDIINALNAVYASSKTSIIKELKLTQLTGEMKLARDVITKTGTLLMAKGQVLSKSVRYRLINFSENGSIEDTVMVEILVATT